MQWRQLEGVLRKQTGAFIIWLMANLGGLIIAYVASGSIYIFHQEWGTYRPNPEAFLISGAISLTVAGSSYLSLEERSLSLSPLLSISWAILLALVYGVLISMGVKPPKISSCSIWWIVVVLTSCCWVWSSILWLHESGIRSELEAMPAKPAGPPIGLQAAADRLPKLEGGSMPEDQ
jgi:hypothetical protein